MDYIEPFKNKAREKRWIVKQYTYDEERIRQAETALLQLTEEVNAEKVTFLVLSFQLLTYLVQSQLTRFCRQHYGELFMAWVHLKLIRVFVESVLRYGLPLQYATFVLKVKIVK